MKYACIIDHWPQAGYKTRCLFDCPGSNGCWNYTPNGFICGPCSPVTGRCFQAALRARDHAVRIRKNRRAADPQRLRSSPAQWTPASDHWLCLVVMDAQSHAELGVSGFRILSPGHAEVGYLLLPEHQGKGFGTESCRAIIDYAAAIGLDSLESTVTDRQHRLLQGDGEMRLQLRAPRPAGLSDRRSVVRRPDIPPATALMKQLTGVRQSIASAFRPGAVHRESSPARHSASAGSNPTPRGAGCNGYPRTPACSAPSERGN